LAHDLSRDGERLVERNRSVGDAVGQRRPLHQFHHNRPYIVMFFQPVDVSDVRMIQRREDFRFALKPCEPIGIRR